MNIIKYCIFIFLIIISIINYCSSSNSSNEIISLYFSSNYGNDNNGNGTIINPYQTLCKLKEILPSPSPSEQPQSINNTIIEINIENGVYFLNNCSNLIIDQTIYIYYLNSITFTTYSSNQQQNQLLLLSDSNVNIYNITLNIINSTILFKGPISISTYPTISNSKVLLQDRVEFIILSIQTKFIRTFFSINHSKYINTKYGDYVICAKCLFQFTNNSELISSEINFHSYLNDDDDILMDYCYKTYGRVCGMEFSNNSWLINSILSMDYFSLNFTDSNWVNSITDFYGIVNIRNSSIEFNKLIPSSIIDIYIDLDTIFWFGEQGYKQGVISKFTISESKINFDNSKIPFSLIGYDFNYNSSIDIENVEITNYKSNQPLIDIVDGTFLNTTISNVGIYNCKSPYFLQIQNGSVNISEMVFQGNSFETLFNVLNNVNLNFTHTEIQCKDKNDFDYTLYISPNSLNTSNIKFEYISIECSGILNFINSVILFYKVNISTSAKDSFITLKKTSGLTIIMGNLISNSFEYGSLFLVDNSSLVILSGTYGSKKSSVISAQNDSEIYIESSQFFSSQTEISCFIIQNSNIDIQNSNFTDMFASTSMIQSKSSNIQFSNSYLYAYGSGSILSSFNSTIKIENIELVNCFTQSSLFIFNKEEKIDILNSQFNINRGISFQLFNISNCNNVNFSNNTFNGNSFSPIIKSVSSSITIQNTTCIDNTGYFLYSYHDTQINIVGFKYNENVLPFELLFFIKGTSSVIFNSISIRDNTFPRFLFYMEKISNVEFNRFSFENNRAIGTNGGVSSFLPPDLIMVMDSLIYFGTCLQITFSESNVNNNSINANLLQAVNSTISILDSSSFSLNNLYTDYLFVVFTSNLIFKNSKFSNNNGDGYTMMWVSYSNITILDCQLSYNNIKNGSGSVMNYNPEYGFSLLGSQLGDGEFVDGYLYNYFDIQNSIFSYNKAGYGGVFYFYGSTENSLSAFSCPKSEFRNNTITFNHASQQGGAIYTSKIEFAPQIGLLYLSNDIRNNTALLGEDFSSEIGYVEFNYYSMTPLNGVETLVTFIFTDRYYNFFTPLSRDINIKITRNMNNFTESKTVSVIAGRGSFYYTFIGEEGIYTIQMKDPIEFNQTIFVQSCLPFQEFVNQTICRYCPIGYAYSKLTNECIYCDTNKLSCLFSSVSALEGYYLIDQDVSLIEECPMEMCLGNNTCHSSYSIDTLCFYCLDQEGNQTIAKNGIRCCTNFEPILLLPILIIYLIFGLLLSIFKYNLFNTPIGSIIIFLQINSVVFFSYSGIYILPLFRMSIDILDGVCYWRNLNYIHKSFISYSIIISLFLIGSTDITLKIIQFIYKKINFKFIKKLINNYNQNSSNLRSTIYKKKSIWYLTQIFIIPLIFNSISLIKFKKIYPSTLIYLNIDFSIILNLITYQIVISIFLSIITIFIIFTTIIIPLVLSIFNLNLNNQNKSSPPPPPPTFINSILNFIKSIILFLIPIQVQLKLNYKRKYKWWDLIIILKSILFCIISNEMIFNNNNSNFLSIIILIQIIYTTLYFLLCPIRINHKQDFNNLINLLNLLIFLISNSSLLKTTNLYNQGLILTCLSFLFSIISILFYFTSKNLKIIENNFNNSFKSFSNRLKIL